MSGQCPDCGGSGYVGDGYGGNGFCGCYGETEGAMAEQQGVRVRLTKAGIILINEIGTRDARFRELEEINVILLGACQDALDEDCGLMSADALSTAIGQAWAGLGAEGYKRADVVALVVTARRILDDAMVRHDGYAALERGMDERLRVVLQPFEGTGKEQK